MRLARISWFVLFASVFIVTVSAAQLAYRFTLPTDGWSAYAGPFGTEDGGMLIYQSNLLGGSSPLRRGDRVHAVESYVLDPIFFDLGLGEEAVRARWESGMTVAYSVLRDGKRERIDVPARRWTVAAWLAYTVRDINRLGNTLGTWLMLLVAGIVFVRKHETPAARALLLLCASLLAQWISGSLPDGVSVTLYPAVREFTFFFTYSIYLGLIAPALFDFTLVFPQRKATIERRPWLLALPFAAAWCGFFVMHQSGKVELGWLGTLLFLLASVAAVVHSLLTARDPVSRAQLRWAGWGFLVGLGLTMLTFLPMFGLVNGTLSNLMRMGSNLGVPVVGISLAVAILRYRLFDLDLIIRRTLIYTAVTTMLVGLYLASIVLLQEIFRSLTGQNTNLAIVVSTLAIVVLFNPLRLRVQSWIDRRFYRGKYDAEQIVASFAQMAQNEADLGIITSELVNVIRTTMQPRFAGLWLANSAELADSGTIQVADTAAKRLLPQQHEWRIVTQIGGQGPTSRPE